MTNIIKETLQKTLAEIGDQISHHEVLRKNRCDTFDTYYKKINDYEVCVSKHINSKSWSVTLVEWDESGNHSDEITINYDATFDWVIQLTDVLSNGT